MKIHNTKPHNFIQASPKSQTNDDFDKILSSSQANFITNVSKDEFNKAINNIFNKMQQIINTNPQKSDEYTMLKNHFQSQVEIYELVLNNATKRSQKLSGSYEKELANNLAELNNDMFLQYSLGYGISKQAERFFEAAGFMDKNIQADIDKIAKYIQNTQHQVKLDNGVVIKKDNKLNALYLHMKNESKNDILQTLLKLGESEKQNL